MVGEDGLKKWTSKLLHSFEEVVYFSQLKQLCYSYKRNFQINE